MGDDKILISKQKYICIDNNPRLFIIGEIYTIYKYKNIFKEKIFYRIFNNKNEWEYSFEIDSVFENRLKESFILIKELRKQKLKKIYEYGKL